MATAGAWGALLVHDGEVADGPALAQAMPGESVRVKGEPSPFAPPPGSLRLWRPLEPLMGNHTYVLEDAEATVLLASQRGAPAGVVVAEGTVGYVGLHPDGSGRLLVLVHVEGWTQPLLFR